MSRSQRLFSLMQLLRRHRRPVSAAMLAEKLGVSVRTLYRDIAALQSQGARIDGEAGIGYVLQPGFTLPPLMFSENELEAINLGVQWVAESADSELSEAAEDVLAKIAAMVPETLRQRLYSSPLVVGPVKTPQAEKRLLHTLRTAIGEERAITIHYRDGQGRKTVRTIWPFGLAFFEEVRLVMAWCEKRGALRHFRTDRIVGPIAAGEPYPRGRSALLADWRREMARREQF